MRLAFASALVGFVLLAGGPTGAFDVRSIELPANGLIFDPGSGRLYASVPSRIWPFGTPIPRAIANSIVPIDPRTGELGAPAFVGSEPNRLALSDDASTLYVGLDGAFAVRRVALPALAPGLQLPLGIGPANGALRAEDIDVQPGNPDVVAVSRRVVSGSPRGYGVAIFDHGVQRPLAGEGRANQIEFSEQPGLLYGFQNDSSAFDFCRLAVDEDGARVIDSTRGLLLGFSTLIEFAAGRVYGSEGTVIDPGVPKVVGQYSGVSPGQRGVAVDAEAGEVYLLASDGLVVYDLERFVLLGAFPIPGVYWSGYESADFIQWGPGAFAFHTSERVYFVELDAGARDPGEPDAALAQCEEGRLDAEAELYACLYARGNDVDGDGEHDSRDRCRDTPPGLPVDDSGCAQVEFCRAEAAFCERADWRNDEPRGKPLDCAAYGSKRQLDSCRPAVP